MEGNELLNPEPKHTRDELSGDRSPVARQSRRRRSRTRSPAGGRDASLSPSAAARPRKVAVAKESAARRAAKRMNYERSSVALLQRQSRHAVKAAKVGGSSLCVCPCVCGTLCVCVYIDSHLCAASQDMLDAINNRHGESMLQRAGYGTGTATSFLPQADGAVHLSRDAPSNGPAHKPSRRASLEGAPRVSSPHSTPKMAHVNSMRSLKAGLPTIGSDGRTPHRRRVSRLAGDLQLSPTRNLSHKGGSPQLAAMGGVAKHGKPSKAEFNTRRRRRRGRGPGPLPTPS